MSEDERERSIFLKTVVKTMVATVKFRRAFLNILKEVGIDSVVLMGNELENERYFSLIGDGTKVRASEKKIRELKSKLIEIQRVCLLHMKAPNSLTGLHNAIARILSKLVDSSDGFHTFFHNPIHEFYGFVNLKRGWNDLETFEAEYSIVREVLKDLLDPMTYRENFENIENITIL